MNPIVPIIMTAGAILFFIGLAALIRRGFKKSKTIRFFRKEYGFGRFVATVIVSGVTLIMTSIYIQKLFPVESIQTNTDQVAIISSNLKYELSTILPSEENNTSMTRAINRFQKEYQEALENGDKKTTELLILEMAFLIRTELENQNYPSHQIGSEVERIMNFLKRKPD
ncbi:hypothetical protein [Nitrosomonas marina]|uniref:Uncharacterized protein n=1 Tax=Nitrosomonas marina TaxID=917 RepID=A0A1H8BFA9_9PROT|nr:hypothetical protein [Nitrosomonas marina]SEM81149.1 hypothetical protein SAMN05216325_102231 [Nitrosomonas marina]